MTSEMLQAEVYLKVINDRGKRRLPLKRVYRNMRRRGLFIMAYGKLYANRGATTIGTDPEDTIQGMSLARIDKIIQQLADGTYRWKPGRRTYVPKADGQQRPIAVPNWSDKLVQEVMRMILEAYYEPQFDPNSHGFRPHRGCHTALRAIQEGWTGTRWFIEGDIRGCFDEIDHDILVNIIQKDIQDERFIKLLKGMLKAGYLEDWRYHQSFSGAPQGGIISPLLSNILLNQLDTYVREELVPQHTKGKVRSKNPEYKKITQRIYYVRKHGQKKRIQELKKQQRQLPSRTPDDPHFRRLRYTRYADDFLLGFIGPKSEAQQIKQALQTYLQTIGLTLSETKTKISHAKSEPARFLGYEITTAHGDTKLSTCKGHKPYKRRATNAKIQLRVPRDVATKWVSRFSRSGKPIHQNRYVNLSDYEIVASLGSQLRGLINYYKLAVNLSTRLHQVRWTVMEATRKTLMRKHKMSSTGQSYRRYYRDGGDGELKHIRITIAREDKPPLIAKCGETNLKRIPTWKINDQIPNDYIAGRRNELTRRLLAEECELCGASGPVEGHHVRKLADLKKRWKGRKKKPWWVESMIARNRKSVFVCRQCHLDITYGRYDGPKVG